MAYTAAPLAEVCVLVEQRHVLQRYLVQEPVLILKYRHDTTCIPALPRTGTLNDKKNRYDMYSSTISRTRTSTDRTCTPVLSDAGTRTGPEIQTRHVLQRYLIHEPVLFLKCRRGMYPSAISYRNPYWF